MRLTATRKPRDARFTARSIECYPANARVVLLVAAPIPRVERPPEAGPNVVDGNKSIANPWKRDMVANSVVRQGSPIEDIVGIFIQREQHGIPAIRAAFCSKTQVLGIFPIELGVVKRPRRECVGQGPREPDVSPREPVLSIGDIRALDERATQCCLSLMEERTECQ